MSAVFSDSHGIVSGKRLSHPVTKGHPGWKWSLTMLRVLRFRALPASNGVSYENRLDDLMSSGLYQADASVPVKIPAPENCLLLMPDPVVFHLWRADSAGHG